MTERFPMSMLIGDYYNSRVDRLQINDLRTDASGSTETEAEAQRVDGLRWRQLSSDWLGLVYRCVDSLLLLAVLVYQNYTLTYFITSFNRHNSVWYFLLLVDFLMVFLFMCGAFFAIRYYRKLHVLNRRKVFTNEEQSNKRCESAPNLTMFSIRWPQWLGTLPLVWICWFFYALLLSVKIFLLHLQKITIYLRTDSVKAITSFVSHLCFVEGVVTHRTAHRSPLFGHNDYCISLVDRNPSQQSQ